MARTEQSSPSIFNHVIGPVMRGPSSSHSAASNRIARIARDLVGEPFHTMIVRYDPNGSLVTTHKEQGSDLGLYSGLLGWTPEDERLPTWPFALKDAGITVEARYESYDAPHPNFYRLELTGNSGTVYHLDAISTGGGMIDLQAIDGIPLHSAGDLNHTLFWLDSEPAESAYRDSPLASACEQVSWHPGPDGRGLLNLASRETLDPQDVATLAGQLGATRHRQLAAVLPVLSRREITLPFETCAEMLDAPSMDGLPLWERAAHYEAARGGLSIDEVQEMMKDLATIMAGAVEEGLRGTSYHDRVLPSQSPGFLQAETEGRLVPGDISNRIIRYVSAIMETKSSMGTIVAAPTAGSCGAMPGAVLAVADALDKDETERARALLIAGLIGVFISRDSTFAAEEGGCMAECGSGSAMAAAAIVHLVGGTIEQSLGAASMALQNSFGMTCDPIANRVEAPCLGKNVMAATNALACANMALAGYQHLVPLDEVIIAMNKVAHQIPRELRCTALGGLSLTPTSQRITKLLAEGFSGDSPAN
ncbi:MAG: L-serine ammonia-lyase, iron-sulfur-dependent, subunit alpha [Verrucomicrobiales bacterium]|nr:L-serine ammonia-lyase, iron-sulfur-dependent, subunit alpha [Verrucomicrobiota bacterium JB025]